MDDKRTPADPPATSQPRGVRVLKSEELLGGQREVWIDHKGLRYRLRETRQGRLILDR